jgi:glycosyltransferase involved in cell wall biosynthesis
MSANIWKISFGMYIKVGMTLFYLRENMAGDAGIMIAPDDFNGAAQAMETLLHIPKQRQEYIRRGFERSKHFR